jgi:hypothetical protein
MGGLESPSYGVMEGVMGNSRTLVFFVAVATCGALAGCGKQDAPQAATADSLLGSWIAADLSHQPTSEVALRMQQGIAEGALRFEFADAGRVKITAGQDEPQQGTWSVVSTEGNRMVVRIATGDAASEAQYEVQFQDRDRFTMRRLSEGGAEELTYTFTRVRA